MIRQPRRPQNICKVGRLKVHFITPMRGDLTKNRLPRDEPSEPKRLRAAHCSPGLASLKKDPDTEVPGPSYTTI